MNVNHPISDEEIHKQYQTLRRSLARTPYVCTGSVMSRYSRCGKPQCACHTDERARHGPYFVWTRKVKGKTVTRTLTVEQAELCKRCIGAMRELEKTIETMKDLTVRYIENQK